MNKGKHQFRQPKKEKKTNNKKQQYFSPFVLQRNGSREMVYRRNQNKIKVNCPIVWRLSCGTHLLCIRTLRTQIRPIACTEYVNIKKKNLPSVSSPFKGKIKLVEWAEKFPAPLERTFSLLYDGLFKFSVLSTLKQRNQIRQRQRFNFDSMNI